MKSGTSRLALYNIPTFSIINFVLKGLEGGLRGLRCILSTVAHRGLDAIPNAHCTKVLMSKVTNTNPLTTFLPSD